MAMTISGTNGLTFNDASTQSSGKQVCKAWVNFIGSTATINGSFNVSSVTRSGTGLYSIAFTTAMANANYSPVVAVSITQGSSFNAAPQLWAATTGYNVATPSASSLPIACLSINGAAFADPGYVCASIFSS